MPNPDSTRTCRASNYAQRGLATRRVGAHPAGKSDLDPGWRASRVGHGNL